MNTHMHCCQRKPLHSVLHVPEIWDIFKQIRPSFAGFLLIPLFLILWISWYFEEKLNISKQVHQSISIDIRFSEELRAYCCQTKRIGMDMCVQQREARLSDGE